MIICAWAGASLHRENSPQKIHATKTPGLFRLLPAPLHLAGCENSYVHPASLVLGHFRLTAAPVAQHMYTPDRSICWIHGNAHAQNGDL